MAEPAVFLLPRVRSEHGAGAIRTGSSAAPDLIEWRHVPDEFLKLQEIDHARRHQAPRHRPVRYRAPRPAHGRGRYRCPGRDVEAQRPVPARRSPRLLLRIHGRDGTEPLPAGFRLPEGRAAKGRLLRPSHGGLSERGKTVLGVGGKEKGVDFLPPLSPKGKPNWIQTGFIPLHSAAVLRKAFPNAELVDAL